MRHFVNFSLLFFFSTLVASGLLRFFKPFELVTTRVHVVFGLGVLVMVLLHLLSQAGYYVRRFRRGISRTGETRPPPWILLGLVAGVWAAVLAATLWNLPPVPQVMGQSYESKNRAVIFRPKKTTAVREIDNGFQIRSVSKGEAMIQVEVIWGPAFQPGGRFAEPFQDARPQVAVWAESDTGAMIETFFVSEESAFSEGVKWAGNPLGRVDILPLWRHSYTLLNGIDPKGEVDAWSAATPEHSFSVSDYMNYDAAPFTVNVEVNVPGDGNEYYHPDQPKDANGHMLPGLGQPSVLYTAYIRPAEGGKYYLLEFTGHGGSSSEMDGKIFYNTKNLTTAKHLVERILVKVVMPE